VAASEVGSKVFGLNLVLRVKTSFKLALKIRNDIATFLQPADQGIQADMIGFLCVLHQKITFIDRYVIIAAGTGCASFTRTWS
jgi:hypothetical protein